VKQAQALEESYAAEQAAERVRAEREQATQYANVVVPAEIEKRRIETLAEAEAERIRRVKKGEADGIREVMAAEAAGTMAILSQKAEGLRALVAAAGGSPELASLLMVTEQMPSLVRSQVEAISNLKIDKVTVWDSGNGADGKNATANFLSGMIGAIPPLHEITRNVSVRLPEFLGEVTEDTPVNGGARAEAPDANGGDGGAAPVA